MKRDGDDGPVAQAVLVCVFLSLTLPSARSKMRFSLLHILPLCLIAASIYISEPASDEKCSNLEVVIGKRGPSFLCKTEKWLNW